MRLVGEIPVGVPVPGSARHLDWTPSSRCCWPGARRRLRRLHRQHPHRPSVRRPPQAADRRRSGSCSPWARPTSASVLLHGFPVSSSGSRTAIGDAVGGRTQLAGLVTVGVHRCWPCCSLRAAPGGASPRGPRRRGGVRRHPAGRRRRAAALRPVPPQRARARPRHHGGGAGARTCCYGIAGRGRRSPCSTCCAGSPGPHDAVQGLVPGLAGMHDVDDYPTAEVVPGLLVYRYDSPLFFANAEDFRTRALAAVDAATGRCSGSSSTPRRTSRSTSPRSTRWSRCARS